MLRAPIINSALRGYLDLLGIRFNGRNPQQTSEVLQPTVDLSQWYLETNAVLMTSNSIVVNADEDQTNKDLDVPGISVGGVLTVPNNQIWLLLPGTNVRTTFTQVAGQSALTPGLSVIENNGAGAVMQVPLAGQTEGATSSAATHDTGNRRGLDVVFWTRPGDRIVLRTYGVVAAANNVTFSAALKVVRLDI